MGIRKYQRLHAFSYIHSFIHSFWPFLRRPFKSSTTQRLTRLQHGYYIGVSRRSAQATLGKGLAQGLYVAARAGVEPTTRRLKVHYPPNIERVSSMRPSRLSFSLTVSGQRTHHS